MIADVFWVKVVHEAIGSIVDSEAKQTHVVSVEDAMAETNALPGGNHNRRALHQFLKHDFCPHIDLLSAESVSDSWVKVLYEVIDHWYEHFTLHSWARARSLGLRILGQENLKASEAHEGRRDTHHHRTLLVLDIAGVELVSLDLGLVRYNQAGSSRRGTAKMEHGLRRKIFSDGRA